MSNVPGGETKNSQRLKKGSEYHEEIKKATYPPSPNKQLQNQLAHGK
jgi:hypothetical protein